MKDNHFLHHEESDYFNIRKDARQARKLASRRDQSKYKKSDQDKIKTRVVKEAEKALLKRGICLSIRPQQCFVECEGREFLCTIRGFLKKERSKMKNLVIVGDIVLFEPAGDNTGVIIEVEPRKSILSRADHLSQQKEHPIAANVDQVFITISTVDPPLRPPIIDRYLIAAIKGQLRPIILCNKVDLLENPHYDEEVRKQARDMVEECRKIYTAIGIDFLEISVLTGEGLDLLKEKMKDRISVFSGQSGTGKSSLINATAGLDLKVGKTVSRTRKGSHTTSFTLALPLENGGWCIDTPGIKSFGVWDLKEEDLRTFFTEINSASSGCKFPDCRHLQEPECAVQKAVEEGSISPLRYTSYLNLLEEIKQEHLRR